jgi:hypothetical protein
MDPTKTFPNFTSGRSRATAQPATIKFDLPHTLFLAMRPEDSSVVILNQPSESWGRPTVADTL